MTDADRRVASLAATFAKERAPALLARLGTDSAGETVRLAARLAAAPRPDRLQALAAAITAQPAADIHAAASLERPRVARVLVAVAPGGSPPKACAPLLVRLCRERIGR